MGVKNSYPTLIEVAPGDYRPVWDSGIDTRPRTRILFGKLKVDPCSIARLGFLSLLISQRFFAGYGGSKNDAAVARIVINGRVQQALI